VRDLPRHDFLDELVLNQEDYFLEKQKDVKFDQVFTRIINK
jgi:hypothetical protein